VDRVLGGYGDVGTTIVPPVLTNWHVEPTNPRKFDIELAKQKLDAAGYKLDADGRRLDKEGKPITLRMFMPDSDENYPKAAQFIAAWYDELGVKVTTQVFSSAALTEIIYPPEGGEGYTADYDIELWGWSGGIDPNGLLQIFKCDAIGDSSDSQYCNPAYDKMYDDQLAAQTAEERKTILAEMQNLIYDKAVYDILYYDANLVGYRTDRFAGFVNQPDNGTPFFTYSTLQYTKLTDATLATPAPSVAPASSAPSGSDVAAAPSAVPTTGDAGAASSTTPILLGLLAVVAVVAVGVAYSRRRTRATGTSEDDE
jgi:peptide/nickel transport system substrate-binding protein